MHSFLCCILLAERKTSCVRCARAASPPKVGRTDGGIEGSIGVVLSVSSSIFRGVLDGEYSRLAKKENTAVVVRKKNKGGRPKGSQYGSLSARRDRRAKKNREINQVELRAALAAGQHHVNIVSTVQQIDTLFNGISKRKFMEKEEQAAFMSKLAALRIKGEFQLRLLGKYLPDLRSVDVGTGGPDAPLSHALAAWAQALDRGVEE